jgi:phage terminase large subunit
VARQAGQEWPNARWQTDPVGFARTILGVDLWRFQIELLEAIRNHRNVACAGGRKIGKDFAVAVAALWWWSSFPRAKVMILAPSAKQIDGILYLEIRQLFASAGRCLKCRTKDPEGPRPCPHSAILSGKVSELARTGIQSEDFRSIVGQTAVAGGGVRGFSGAKLLYIEDEAAEIKDAYNTVMVGNLAGSGAKQVWIGNPSRAWGHFYRAFHEERDIFHPIQQSTEDNPNITTGRDLYPGLADRAWLEERAYAWGRGSALWASDVEGKFPKAEQGQLFSLEMIKDASSEERKNTARALGGDLFIGIDVAGDGSEGDETVFAVRRGNLPIDLVADRGLTRDEILVRLRDLIARHRMEADKVEGHFPVVVVDSDGGIGERVYQTLSGYRTRDAQTEREFRVIGFHGGQHPSPRWRHVYRWTKDLLYAGFLEWLKEGGCIPNDNKLWGDMMAIRWKTTEIGASTLEPKQDVRDRLGRSPDRADAWALCTYKADPFAKPQVEAQSRQAPPPSRDFHDANEWGYDSHNDPSNGDPNAIWWTQ